MNTKLATSTVLAAAALLAPAAAMAHRETTEPSGDEPAFCPAWNAAVQMFSGDGEIDPAAAEQVIADVTANTPEEIGEPVGVVVEAAGAAAGGDFSGFESEDFANALGAVDGWAFDNCAFDAKIEVTAVDWAFGGIPLEIPAGRVAFRLHNIGEEIHEIAIVRKVEGTTESFQELAPLIAMEDESVMAKVEFLGAAFSPNADVAGVAIVDLEPGEYAAICFIPVGSLQGAEPGPGDAPGEEPAGSAPAGSEAEPEYDPHFAHGMLQEFTVVEAG